VATHESQPLLRDDLVEATLGSGFPKVSVHMEKGELRGQAASVLNVLDSGLVDMDEPLAIVGCDQVWSSYEGQEWTPARVLAGDADAVVTCAYKEPDKAKGPWSWASVTTAGRKSMDVVAVESRPSAPKSSWVAVGAWWLRRAGDFRKAACDLIEKGKPDAAGEYAVADVLGLLIRERKYRVKVEVTEHFYPLRTTDEVDAFAYEHRYLGADRDWRKTMVASRERALERAS
jgi:hypothetical protein